MTMLLSPYFASVADRQILDGMDFEARSMKTLSQWMSTNVDPDLLQVLTATVDLLHHTRENVPIACITHKQDHAEIPSRPLHDRAKLSNLAASRRLRLP